MIFTVALFAYYLINHAACRKLLTDFTPKQTGTGSWFDTVGDWFKTVTLQK